MSNITGKKPSQLGTPEVSIHDAILVIETSDGKVVQTPFVSLEKRIKPDSNSVATQSVGDNVTISRTQGSCVVTIPENVFSLKQITIDIDAAANPSDQGGDSAYYVDFVYQGTRDFNQLADLSDALKPTIQMEVFNDAQTVTKTNADQYEITRPSAGTLRVNFLNALQSAADKRKLKFVFE